MPALRPSPQTDPQLGWSSAVQGLIPRARQSTAQGAPGRSRRLGPSASPWPSASGRAHGCSPGQSSRVEKVIHPARVRGDQGVRPSRTDGAASEASTACAVSADRSAGKRRRVSHVPLGRSDRGFLSFVDGAGTDSAGADPRIGTGVSRTQLFPTSRPRPTPAREII